MKPPLWCLPAVLCCTQLLAQSAASPAAGPAPVDPAEYQRIEATRQRETAAFDAQEAECYKHFAVSGCVKDVQTDRRGMLARLRREESLLHEREAALQGAEQKRATEQKLLEKQQQKEAAANKAEAAERLQAQKDKQAAHAAKLPSSAPAKAGESSGPGAAEQASNRASFERKQQDAEKKRQEIARRLAEKNGKSAKPLPVPP